MHLVLFSIPSFCLEGREWWDGCKGEEGGGGGGLNLNAIETTLVPRLVRH